MFDENFSPYVNGIVEECWKKAAEKEDKYGSYAIAVALFEIAKSLNMLGFGRTTHPGAIEGHTMKMMESFSKLANSIDSIAKAVEEKDLTSA
jgi:hypothetical protein